MEYCFRSTLYQGSKENKKLNPFTLFYCHHNGIRKFGEEEMTKRSIMDGTEFDAISKKATV